VAASRPSFFRRPDPTFRSALAAALLLAAPLTAQIPVAEYAARRDTVAARLGDGVLLAFGVADPATDAAEFRQLPSFAWLTGYERLNAAFVMVVRAGRPVAQLLFEPPIDPRRALYDGFAPDSPTWRSARASASPRSTGCGRSSSRRSGAGSCG
jgi:hypothetical protein